MDGCGLGPCNIPLSLLKCHGPGRKRVITRGNAFHSKKNMWKCMIKIQMLLKKDKNTDGPFYFLTTGMRIVHGI
jgi:hypothetical protein